MNIKHIVISLIIILVISTVAVSSFYYLTCIHYTKIENVTLDIIKGESVKSISKKLKNYNVINSDFIFVLYVLINGFQKNLKAGEYEFNGEFSIKDIVSMLLNHEIKLRRVTIPEGLTLSEIGDVFEKNGLFTKNEFMEAVNDDMLKSKLLKNGILSFEGVLFPDTYTYWKDIKPAEIVELMFDRKNKIIEQLQQENGNIHSVNNLSEYEIIILASIIEKESAYETERELVSSVFHNRLQIGMKLDSDPTVIYGLGEKFDGNLRKKDLEKYSLYNTYLIPGLPPTPISSPGKSSLYAALYPADSEYLYFVSRGDGTHYFSKNYSEHRKAVYKYQIKSN